MYHNELEARMVPQHQLIATSKVGFTLVKE